ncbi:L,D-transpeptidase scaffold domain-containing protein [Flaviaesturariibacter terrae]
MTLLLCTSAARAQLLLPEELAAYRKSERYAGIGQFYRVNGGQAVWLQTGRQEALRRMLARAAYWGLSPSDYETDALRNAPLATRADSVRLELALTDAALHFFGDLKAGNKRPPLDYAGLDYKPDRSLDTQQLAQLQRAAFLELAESLAPRLPAYDTLLAALRRLLQLRQDSGFHEERITSLAASAGNKPLLLRLQQLGLLAKGATPDPKTLEKKIAEAQRMFGLFNSGKPSTLFLEVLNVPLARRETELSASLNTLRWLEGLKRRGRVLALNIAAASFVLYEGSDSLLYSKVIAGKPATPTPTLSGTITEVILFPYWNVPNKIATRELLPEIKKQRSFLEAGNYQVLDRKGSVLDPRSIDWKVLGPGNFPYVLRQVSGCDNALGVIKFNFYNPFTVYLHDTPGKSLFLLGQRFFSHGCMRVEKPTELAAFVLGSKRRAVDTLTAIGCLRATAPKTITAEVPLPIVVFYNTAWLRPDGRLCFYQDVYHKNRFLQNR